MTKRTAKFVSAIAASFLAGAPLTTPSHSASADCLSGPKDQTPHGSHWYYHIDHTTKRHCWYLADEREKSSHASSASAKSALHKPEDTLPRKVADAHAELATADNTERLNRRNTANSPIVTPPSEGAPLAEEQSSVISSRWPNQALADASVIPSPNKSRSATAVITRADPYSKAQPASIQSVEQRATADVPLQSQSDQTQVYSLQILLIAMAGVLALAGIITSLVIKFDNSRAIARPNDHQWSARQTGLTYDAYAARDRASKFFAKISQRHQI